MSKVYRQKSDVKRMTITQKILIIILILLIGFGVITKFNQMSSFNKVYDTFSMIRYTLLDHPIKQLQNLSDTLAGYEQLADENHQLKNELATNKLYKARFEDNEGKIKELEAMMNLTVEGDFVKEYASVISRDVQGVNSIVTINKGKNFNISVDDVVLNVDGLVGKVVEVDDHLAKVQLLNAAELDSNVAVKVRLDNGKSVLGVLDGYNQENNAYHVQIYDAGVDVAKGAEVVTSGEGGLYPRGILVGKVESLDKIYSGNGKNIYVKPSIKFNSIDEVIVLRKQG